MAAFVDFPFSPVDDSPSHSWAYGPHTSFGVPEFFQNYHPHSDSAQYGSRQAQKDFPPSAQAEHVLHEQGHLQRGSDGPCYGYTAEDIALLLNSGHLLSGRGPFYGAAAPQIDEERNRRFGHRSCVSPPSATTIQRTPSPQPPQTQLYMRSRTPSPEIPPSPTSALKKAVHRDHFSSSLSSISSSSSSTCSGKSVRFHEIVEVRNKCPELENDVIRFCCSLANALWNIVAAGPVHLPFCSLRPKLAANV